MSEAPHHAAVTVCWLSTVAIFRQPSILRNLICRDVIDQAHVPVRDEALHAMNC